MIADLLTALFLIALGVVLAGGGIAAFVMWVGSRSNRFDRHPDETPDSVDEHFKSAPRVVAGSDIDRQKSIERTRVDIVFGGIVADTLADLDAHLSAYYVTPEGDR